MNKGESGRLSQFFSSEEVDDAIQTVDSARKHNVIVMSAVKSKTTEMASKKLSNCVSIFEYNGTTSGLQMVKEMALKDPEVRARKCKFMIDIILSDFVQHFDAWSLDKHDVFLLQRGGVPVIAVANTSTMENSDQSSSSSGSKHKHDKYDWSAFSGVSVSLDISDVRHHLYLHGRKLHIWKVVKVAIAFLFLPFFILAVLAVAFFADYVKIKQVC